MTGAQAQPCSNWLPLEFTILPQKLAQCPLNGGYSSHIIGKGHWGYQTTDHLPIHRGFSSHVGYLAGAEDYVHGDNYGPTHDCSSAKPHEWCFKDMWHDNHTGADIIDQIEYSTNYYARRTVDLIESAPSADAPLALFLLYQGVHVPYGAIPDWENRPVPGFWDQTYGNMLRIVDDGVANVTTALRAAGRWDDSAFFPNQPAAPPRHPSHTYLDLLSSQHTPPRRPPPCCADTPPTHGRCTAQR